jgi:hypothetical protein
MKEFKRIYNKSISSKGILSAEDFKHLAFHLNSSARSLYQNEQKDMSIFLMANGQFVYNELNLFE